MGMLRCLLICGIFERCLCGKGPSFCITSSILKTWTLHLSNKHLLKPSTSWVIWIRVIKRTGHDYTEIAYYYLKLSFNWTFSIVPGNGKWHRLGDTAGFCRTQLKTELSHRMLFLRRHSWHVHVWKRGACRPRQSQAPAWKNQRLGLCFQLPYTTGRILPLKGQVFQRSSPLQLWPTMAPADGTLLLASQQPGGSFLEREPSSLKAAHLCARSNSEI